MKYSKQAASKKVVDEGSIKTLAEALASLDLPTVSKERLKHSYPRILVSQLMSKTVKLLELLLRHFSGKVLQ